MNIGLYSPMPPAPTGVADYSAVLFDYLRKYGDIAVNPESCDLALYHLGNNPLHREIYQQALELPGVIVLHDGVLNHFFLGFGNPDFYTSEFEYNYGVWTRGLAQDLWSNRSRSGTDPRYFAYPMLKRIAETSKAVIVHNLAAAKRVLQHAPGARVIEIPHLFRKPEVAPAPSDIAPLQIGVFGHQRETKRLGVVLRAFARAVAAGADVKLLVSGQFLSDTYERALGPLLDHPGITRTGYLDDARFWSAAATIDVCINLRYPSAAETSGIAISMMGLGKTVIFTAGDELARFPENACLRLEPGPAEETTLVEYLCWLAGDHNAARQIGLRAARHIAAEHDPDKVARAYWDVLNTA